jgi:predicted phosphodiesterase
MSKIALLTDTHFGIRGDSVKFLNYFADYYNNFFFPYLEKNKIKTIIHLGDLVDRRKYININTGYQLNKLLFERIDTQKIEYHQILGNHDCYYRNTNRLNIFSTIQYKPYCLYENVTEVIIDGCKVLLVPWICDENREHTFEMIKKTDALYCFGHFEFGGFQMYKGLPSHGGMDRSAFNKFDLVCSGHYHHRSRDGNVQYLGAAMEYTWSDYDDPRGFAVFDTDIGSLEFVDSPVRIFEKAFYDDSASQDLDSIDFARFKDKIVKVVIKNKGNPYVFDQFMERLEEQGIIELQVVEDHLNLDVEDDDSIIDEAESTVDIFTKFIDQTETGGVPKDRIKNVMVDLYREAIDLQ